MSQLPVHGAEVQGRQAKVCLVTRTRRAVQVVSQLKALDGPVGIVPDQQDASIIVCQSLHFHVLRHLRQT